MGKKKKFWIKDRKRRESILGGITMTRNSIPVLESLKEQGLLTKEQLQTLKFLKESFNQ